MCYRVSMGRVFLGMMRLLQWVSPLAAVGSLGCSLIFVSSPPRDAERIPPSEPIECTSSKAAPLLDTLMAGFQVVRTGLALSKDDYDYIDSPISRDADIGIGAGLTTLFTVSAVYGFTTTARCDEVKNEHRRAADEKSTEANEERPPQPQVERRRPLANKPKAPPAPPENARPRSTPSSVYVLGGATVGLAVGAGVTGALYLSKRSEFEDLNRNPNASSDRRSDARQTASTLSTVNLFLTTGALIGAGVTSAIYFSSSSNNSSAQLAPWVGPGSAGAALSGNF